MATLVYINAVLEVLKNAFKKAQDVFYPFLVPKN